MCLCAWAKPLVAVCDCTNFVAGIGGNVYHQVIASLMYGFLLHLHIRAFTISTVIISVVAAAAFTSISFVSFKRSSAC